MVHDKVTIDEFIEMNHNFERSRKRLHISLLSLLDYKIEVYILWNLFNYF